MWLCTRTKLLLLKSGLYNHQLLHYKDLIRAHSYQDTTMTSPANRPRFPNLPLRRFWFSASRWEILARSSLWSPADPEEVVLVLCNKENQDETHHLFTCCQGLVKLSEAESCFQGRRTFESQSKHNLGTRTITYKYNRTSTSSLKAP